MHTQRVGLTAPALPRPERPAVANGRVPLAVVVPVYARTRAHVALLLRTLEHLAAQARAPDFVVLVDDGGPLPLPTSFDGLKQVQPTDLASSGDRRRTWAGRPRRPKLCRWGGCMCSHPKALCSCLM